MSAFMRFPGFLLLFFLGGGDGGGGGGLWGLRLWFFCGLFCFVF